MEVHNADANTLLKVPVPLSAEGPLDIHNTSADALLKVAMLLYHDSASATILHVLSLCHIYSMHWCRQKCPICAVGLLAPSQLIHCMSSLHPLSHYTVG